MMVGDIQTHVSRATKDWAMKVLDLKKAENDVLKAKASLEQAEQNRDEAENQLEDAKNHLDDTFDLAAEAIERTLRTE